MRAVQFESDLNLAEAVAKINKDSEAFKQWVANNEPKRDTIDGEECVMVPVTLLEAYSHLMDAVDATVGVMGLEPPDDSLRDAARKCIADIHRAAETTHDSKIDGQVFKALDGLKDALK